MEQKHSYILIIRTPVISKHTLDQFIAKLDELGCDYVVKPLDSSEEGDDSCALAENVQNLNLDDN